MDPDLPILKPNSVVRILGPGIIDSQGTQSPKILALKQDRLLLGGGKAQPGRVKDSLSPERPWIERIFPETSVDKRLVDRLDSFGILDERRSFKDIQATGKAKASSSAMKDACSGLRSRLSACFDFEALKA